MHSLTDRTDGPNAPAPKLMLIGIDSATWHVMTPLIERGELPNLGRLIREGAHGPLRTFFPTLSPLVWSTISTGKSPEKHGMKSFATLKIPGLRRTLYDYRWEQLTPFSRFVHRVLRLKWWKKRLIESGVIVAGRTGQWVLDLTVRRAAPLGPARRAGSSHLPGECVLRRPSVPQDRWANDPAGGDQVL
jgi:hypothetical protein